MNFFKILLAIHIFFGSISLLVGLYVLIVKKGNKRHQFLGNLYFYCMLLAALISFPMSYLHPSYFLFIIGVFTTYMLLSGRRSISKKLVMDVGIVDWILTGIMFLFGMAFIGFGIIRLIHSNYFGMVFLVFGGISLLFVWQDTKIFRGNPRYKNFGLVTHIQRMVASYIATVTAFLVVNNKILPDTIAWLLPTFLLAPLIIMWTIKYNIKVSKPE